MNNNGINSRPTYLNTLLGFLDKEVIKVIMGIRRCGKSTLLKLFAEELLACGIDKRNIIHINFESMLYRDITDSATFYDYISERVGDDKVYLLIDEPQEVSGWEKAINSFKVDFDCDIYITGSNAKMLSSELSTLLSGRYVEINLHPLSYREYLDFHKTCDDEKVYQRYLKFGGFPTIVELDDNVNQVNSVLEGIFNTVIVKDVMRKNNIKDESLLEKIVTFLADNIGNPVSSNSISNTLVSSKRLENGRVSPANMTVENYITSLEKAFIFYKAKRYDVKGKKLLKTLGKYYIVDMGLRNMLLGYRDVDKGHILENIVFLELKRRGYTVYIGKIGEKEIDFIAEKATSKIYVQACESLKDKKTLDRELTPLLAVSDNYEKFIITNDETFVESYSGIKVKNTRSWLLEE
jgi:predicted AAA+ superfamily ATPase